MKQTYQRALKAAADFGYQKESPEWVLLHFSFHHVIAKMFGRERK